MKTNIKEERGNGETEQKYSRGDKIYKGKIQTQFFKHKYSRNEDNIKYAVKQSNRAEILLNEESGYLVAESDEETTEYTQSEIVQNVDITSASKCFKLNLEEFGPYKINYTKNGRHLLLGGRKGHIAALDWTAKKLYCEFSVMEEIYDIKWLHLETLFAVAQKKWTHIYDNKGTEIHCIKKMHDVNQLEYLPYHFLLASGSADGYLKWLDVSIGEMVSEYKTIDEKVSIMTQNPSNAVLCVGNSRGVVTMYSPSVREPLARVLCHPTPITALSFNPMGDKMVTAGIDKKVKVWDSRMLDEPLIEYNLRSAASRISLSQKNVMAVTMGNVCEIFKSNNLGNLTAMTSYLRHIESGVVTDMEFVPFEDVLGIGSRKGFSSILVPGAGEANFDAIEANPFRTKKQRREYEVHSLLEKIPSELISLDSRQIVGMDLKKLETKLEAKPEVIVSYIEYHNFSSLTNYLFIQGTNEQAEGKEKYIWNQKEREKANLLGNIETTFTESSENTRKTRPYEGRKEGTRCR